MIQQKMLLSKLVLMLLIKITYLIKSGNNNEVIGCGGFIKSHADIDFTKVEVKLLNKQGTVKDKTDCSPSNGYYFLPIYDKGNYILSISPPPGWSFEPENVELNFDGKSDICSQGKDVNFVFKGFGITGKVEVAGHVDGGACDVNIELKSESAVDVRETITDINGVFSFSPIIPGKYLIRATHARWHFSKAEHSVTVVSGNTVLPEGSLVVSGFDVSGRFASSDQLTAGLGVVLFKKRYSKLSFSCTTKIPVYVKPIKDDYETAATCYAANEKSGEYIFKDIPSGKYLLQATNENPKLKIHLSPEYIEIDVGKDTVQIRDEFKITGFTIEGKVLANLDGVPVKSATIKLNGMKITETADDGSYVLENLKTGTYRVQVEFPQLLFEELTIKIQANTLVLPTIIPSAYEICGTVVSPKSYVVGITKIGSTYHTTSTTKPNNGGWCSYLPKGKYIIEVVTTDADKNSGVKFFPVQQQIEVKSSPIKGIIFSQLRAKLQGEIRCLPDATHTCNSAKVTLQALSISGQATQNVWRTKAQYGKYSFSDVLPGPYEITIPQENLCYESTRILLNVATANEEAPSFIHKGYEVTIISSHRAVMKFTHLNGSEQSKSPTNSLKLLEGTNIFCVNKFGIYDFRLESCHLYDNSLPSKFYTPEPGQQQIINISAIAHKVGLRILSTESSQDSLKLLVESQSLGNQVVTPIQESYKVDGKYVFRYNAYLKPQEILQITPQSDMLLFTPQTKEIVGGNDCIDVAFNFVASRGLILRGKVLPPIKDVKIILRFPENPKLNTKTTLTSGSGEFIFSPIDEHLAFDLTAEKESYVFSEYNRQSASFNAYKLCEVTARVIDESGKPLSGVLLSLSGSESYRKNLITGDDGIINFHSLSPSQYFLRPMMKEYKFEPNSKMIKLGDGETVEVKLTGKRYAYSIFGFVKSLNGEPFSQVNIEAVSDEKCMHQQEEAISETNGQYRIRGLQPGCTYIVQHKNIGTQNPDVERTIPSKHTIVVGHKDIRDVNLTAISPITTVDVTVRITTVLNEQYKTLRIVMYRRGASDSPVFSQRVPSPLNPKSSYNPGITVYFPRIPLDGKTYIVELQSTLSMKTYSYKLPVETFVANKSSIFLELDFRPELRTVETDINQNSISALVLVTLVTIAFLRQDLAVDFFNFVWSRGNNLVVDFTQKQRNNAKKDTRRPEFINQRENEQITEQINAVKKKKTRKI